MQNVEQLNYGLIDVPRRETDYIAGFGNGIAIDELVPDGNWRPYLSRSEFQSGLYFDTYGCVTFSALNEIEAIMNLKIQRGQMTIEDLKWLGDKGYLNDEGKLNFSDRFTAKMSGTGPRGNWLYKVGDSIRKDGLVPETVWPYPRTQRSPVFTREEYYKEIPEDVKKLGLEFLERFKINYEWVVKDYEQHLKTSPLQITVYAWGPLQDGIYRKSTLDRNHAVLLVDYDDYRIIEDHYSPNEKKLDHDYIIGKDALRFVVTNELPIEQDMIRLVKTHDSPTVYQVGADGLYHPIANESFVLNLYGDWKNVKVDEVEGLNPSKVGSTIGEYNKFLEIINNLFNGKK